MDSIMFTNHSQSSLGADIPPRSSILIRSFDNEAILEIIGRQRNLEEKLISKFVVNIFLMLAWHRFIN